MSTSIAVKSGTPGALVIGGAHNSLAIARSLGRRGIPVWYATDDHPLASFSRYVSRRFGWAGRNDPDAALEFLLGLVRREGIEGWVLFPGGDPEVRFIAQHYTELSRHFRLTTPPWDIAQFSIDKSLTYRQAETVGVAFPRSYHPRDRAEVAALQCQFPVVLKPTVRLENNAFTLAKAWKANDQAELLSYYDRAAALVGHDCIAIQEYIPGDGLNQYSYAAVWEHGAPIASVVVRRRRQYPPEFGIGTFVETIDNRDMEDVASRFLRSVNYTGMVELDFKFDARDGRYNLLDFNARPWAWVSLGAPAGVDFPHLAFQAATGASLQPMRGRAGARWMHLARDLVSAAQQIKAGTITVLDYLRTVQLPLTFAAFAVDDPLPGLVELPLTLYRAAMRSKPLQALLRRAPRHETARATPAHDEAAGHRLAEDRR